VNQSINVEALSKRIQAKHISLLFALMKVRKVPCKQEAVELIPQKNLLSI
jgi:hypothetical protein